MQRRSNTSSTPRKRYTVDAFEGIHELQNDSESGAEETGTRDDSADEFNAAVEQPSENEDDDDAMSGIEEELDGEGLDNGAYAGEADLDDSMSIVDEETDSPRPNGSNSTPKKSRAPRIPRTDATGARTYTRGVNDTHIRSMAKDLRRIHFYGSDDRDYKHADETFAKWALDPTLPSRVSDNRGYGGMRRSFFADETPLADEAKTWQSWWHDGGGDAIFTKRQVSETLAEEDAGHYLEKQQSSKVSFLLGPFKDQRLFELTAGQIMKLQDGWSPLTEQHDISHTSVQRGRPGYIFNVGGKVQSLDWSPSVKSKYQLLATSTLAPSKGFNTKNLASEAPAFNPRSYKSIIQIWRFESTEDGRMDPNAAPYVQTLLCTEWGDARALKWQPVFHNEYHIETSALLAGIFTDGAVRVFKISLESEGRQTKILLSQSAAFESRPPNTIYTSLTWISSTRLSAGCANGCIAVWDLPNITSDAPQNIRPTIFSAASASYIVSITSCSPSRPNLLITSTMGGFLTISDLSRSNQSLASQAATISGSRSRMGVSALAVWHDFTQVGLYVDDNYLLRGSAARRIFTSTALARYKSAAVCLASSPCHPFVLVGTANGDVVSSNPVKRIMDGKAGIWQQTWFNHEWRRPSSEEEAQGVGESNKEHEATSTASPATAIPTATRESSPFQIGSQGLSRILEGFRAERCVFAANDRNPYSIQNGVAYATIYEEKTAITALAWNPNLHVGGWAAAGMADGLVRVEDLALDIT